MMRTLFFALVFVPHVRATTFTVTSRSDATDISPGDCVCKSSAGGACTLRAAIQEANACAGTDTIYIQSTATPIQLTITGRGENAAATGDLDVNSDINILGNNVLVDGGRIDRVFSVGEGFPSAHLDIQQLRIVNGLASGGDHGGGIAHYAWLGFLSVRQSSINGNESTSGGGGLYLRHDTTASLFDTQILNNLESGSCQGGGGIYNNGANLTLDQVVASGNTTCGPGGAIRNDPYCPSTSCTGFGVLDVTGFLFENNHASSGGAIYNGQGCTATIGGSVFSSNSATSGYGGALYNYRGSVSLSDSELANNSAVNSGGAIANHGGTLTGAHLAIHNNSSDSRGGGVSGSQYLDMGRTNLLDSQIYANHSDGDGGGVDLEHPSSLVDSNLDDNTADGEGGGAMLLSQSHSLTRCRIRRNQADRGGGLEAGYQSTVTGLELEVSDNRAHSISRGGGGIYASGSTLDLDRVLMSGNIAREGGGLASYFHAVVTVRNSTVSGNTGSSWGGGINAGGDSFSGNNLTITDNTAPSGGGLLSSGTVTTAVQLSNTILGDNHATGTSKDCYGSFTSAGYNLLSVTVGCTVTPATGDLFGMAAHLAPLTMLGGFTRVHPFASSPAVDAGNNATCEPVDQRNLPRPFGARCDMGAYEGP